MKTTRPSALKQGDRVSFPEIKGKGIMQKQGLSGENMGRQLKKRRGLRADNRAGCSKTFQPWT